MVFSHTLLMEEDFILRRAQTGLEKVVVWEVGNR